MKIAIIGTGISGMVAAHLLHEDHDIVIYEAEDYVGGHTHTIEVQRAGATYAVDTGFIVFNERNYPNFVKLLKRLDVPWQPSGMSFSFRDERTGLEYRPSSLSTLFVQRRNLRRPSFLRMVAEIFRFRRSARKLLRTGDDDLTLGVYLRSRRFSEVFIHQFIIPMGAAIWSADPAQFEEFPARYFARFFHNHGFLNIRNQPQWLVIRGGSRQYVKKLIRPFRDRIRLGSPVVSIRRRNSRVELTAKDQDLEYFDYAIIAAHADQALAMLSDPSDAERNILGAFPYQENRTVLHTDVSFLPSRRSAWASWNYLVPKVRGDRVVVTYDMNILQTIRAPVEFCVSLNPHRLIEPGRVLRRMTYHHPVYTTKGLPAQQRRDEINGANRTYFCGAYWGYGFHEDGVKSALSVCRHFGKTL
ncbi:MAG: NAD(P)-binding protein [Anaerolineales bacterium]|nr:NAD(P)-binding protein [Anaerolineales bacterium]